MGIYITKEAIRDCIQLIQYTAHASYYEDRMRECLLMFVAMTRSRCISGEHHDFTDGNSGQC